MHPRRAIIFTLLLTALASQAMAAQSSGTVHQAVPTSPVASKNLDAPVFESDTRNLEAIVNNTPQVAAPAAAPVAAPAPAAPAPKPAPAAKSAAAAAPAKIADVIPPVPELAPVVVPEKSVSGDVQWFQRLLIITLSLLAIVGVLQLCLLRKMQKSIQSALDIAKMSADSARRSAELADSLLKNFERY